MEVVENNSGISFANDSVEYDGQGHNLEVDLSSQKEGCDFSATYYEDIDCTIPWEDKYDAGKYTIYAKLTDANNLLPDFVLSATLEITPKEVTVQIQNYMIQYGEDEPTYNVVLSGIIPEENDEEFVNSILSNIVYSSNYAKGDPIGEYDIAASGLQADNYTFVYEEGILYVEPKELDAPTALTNLVYNGKLQTGLSEYDEGLITVSGGSATNAGTYQATITLNDTTNYKWKDNSFSGKITYTINKETLKITIADATIKYNEDAPTYSIASFETSAGINTLLDSNDTIASELANLTFVCEYQKGSEIGEYTISLSGDSALNYNLEVTNGTLTVTKATYDISSYKATSPTSAVYDGNVKALDESGALPEGVNTTIKYYSDAEFTNEVTPINAGSYYCVITFSNPDSTHYEDIAPITNVTLSIQKAALYVTWSGETDISYDGNEHTLTCAITKGVVTGDTISIIVNGESAKKIGEYTYTLSINGDTNNNYYINASYLTKKITITAPLEKKAITLGSDEITDGSYALYAKNGSTYYILPNTLGTSASTIKTGTCKTTDDIDNYIFSASEKYTIKSLGNNQYNIMIGQKYLTGVTGSSNLTLSDTAFTWTLTSVSRSDGTTGYYFASANNRGLLLNGTTAVGHYASSNAKSYGLICLYKVDTEQAKDITIADATDGTVTYVSSTGTLNGLYNVDTITLTITPDTGKMISDITYGGVSIKSQAEKQEDGTYILVVNPTASGEIAVTFEEAKTEYSVSVTNNENVTIGSYITTYYDGDSVSISLEAKDGYYIKDIKVNDTSVISSYEEDEKTVTFTISANSVITIETDYVYSVSVSDSITNGTITLSSTSVNNGGTTTVSIKASDMYVLDKLYVNDVEYTGEITGTDNQNYTAEITISENTIVKATFKAMEATAIKDVSTSGYYIVTGTVKSFEGNKTITLTDSVNEISLSLSATINTELLNVGLSTNDKVTLYFQKGDTYTSTKNIIDYVCAPTDLEFINSTLQWNGSGSSYDLYMKTGDNDYTLVKEGLSEKEYDFEDTLYQEDDDGNVIVTTYTFKIVAHSINETGLTATLEDSWAYGATYSVTYNINGHGTQPDNLTKQTALPKSLPELTADGYEFKGWYLDAEFANEAIAGTVLKANVNLYAKWDVYISTASTTLTYSNITSITGKTTASYANYNGSREIAIGTLNTTAVMPSSSIIQMQASNGIMEFTFNETVIKINITFDSTSKSTSLTTIGGSSSSDATSLSGTLANSILSFDFGSTGLTYIKFTNGTSNAIKITSIEIIYSTGSEGDELAAKKSAAENAISKLTYTSITKANNEEVSSALTKAKNAIDSYINASGATEDLSNYSTYTSVLALYNTFTTNKSSTKQSANDYITILNEFVTDNSLTSDSELTDEQYSTINGDYNEAISYINSYVTNYGDVSDLNDRTNVTLVGTLIENYINSQNLVVTADYEYNNVDKYSNYYKQWSSSYASRILTSGMFIENTPYVKMNYSAAGLSSSYVTDCPVVKNGTITVEAPDSSINSLTLTLKQYNGKSKTVTIKYYNESNELVSCGSASTFTDGKLVLTTSSLPANVTKIIIDLTSDSTNQVGVESIKVNLSTKAKDLIKTNYYASIDSTYTGETLWSSLETLTTNTHDYMTSYADVAYLAYLTDADPDNPGNILDFYSHLTINGTWDGGNTWNREHLWCQSKAWYGDIVSSTVNAGTDLHHMRPLYKSINSSRNNSQYGELTSISGVSSRDSYLKTYNGASYGYLYGGSEVGTGNGVFEPMDNVKGDVARILMYLLTRYKTIVQTGDANASSYSITKNVYTAEGTDKSVYTLLLSWSDADPVDQLEINRNNAVYALQGNRNPFIDCPNYAHLIWDNID